MTREVAFAMCVFDENEFARGHLPDLTVARFVLYCAIQSHC